jgi:hypothetical protein
LNFWSVLFEVLELASVAIIFALMNDLRVQLFVVNIPEVGLFIPLLLLLYRFLSYLSSLSPMPAIDVFTWRIFLERILQVLSTVVKALKISWRNWGVVLLFDLVFLNLALRCSWDEHLLHIIHCFEIVYIIIIIRILN